MKHVEELALARRVYMKAERKRMPDYSLADIRQRSVHFYPREDVTRVRKMPLILSQSVHSTIFRFHGSSRMYLDSSRNGEG
jgi:hypothetical protein